MARDEKVKPLDKLLDEKLMEFESGEEAVRDKELDNMIWSLGDYESHEPPQEGENFKETPPIEEDLVEKELRISHKEEKEDVSFAEPRHVEEELPGGEKLVEAKTVGLGTEKSA